MKNAKQYYAGRRCRNRDFYTATVAALVVAIIGNHLNWYVDYTLDMAFVIWLVLMFWRTPFLLIAHALLKGEEKEKMGTYIFGYGLYEDSEE